MRSSLSSGYRPIVAFPLLLLLSHCSFGPSASEKAEAGRLNRAIVQLRDAPNAQKGQLLDALKSVRCETRELCELQRACIDGYRQHVSALTETARAKSLLATPDGAAEAARILDAAQSELSQASPKITHCTEAQGAAQRKYKL
ncbi:MAG TPA: hypothetical protein VFK05_17695 [Polyangiaceae bacterium]|nr:hypothetical protein [Polyangiaceae bacterium]